MGKLQAEEMANSGLSLRQQLDWHLRHNHFPPHPNYMVDFCQDVLEDLHAGRIHYDSDVELPSGVRHARYGSSLPVYALVKSFHLEPFIGLIAMEE